MPALELEPAERTAIAATGVSQPRLGDVVPPVELLGKLVETGEELSPDVARGWLTVRDSTDRTARVWAADGPSLVHSIRNANPPCLTPAFRQQFLAESREEALRNYRDCQRERAR